MTSNATTMYDPHAGHRSPELPGLPPHRGHHLNHTDSLAVSGLHNYNNGTSNHHISATSVTSHLDIDQLNEHKRDKEAIYG
jgi:homeobox protein homothorax